MGADNSKFNEFNIGSLMKNHNPGTPAKNALRTAPKLESDSDDECMPRSFPQGLAHKPALSGPKAQPKQPQDSLNIFSALKY